MIRKVTNPDTQKNKLAHLTQALNETSAQSSGGC